MTPQTAKYPLLRRPRAKRVNGPRLPVKYHKYCELHPERLVPRFKAGARCWLCETKDEKAFAELDFLIKIGLESVPQVRITAAVRLSAMAQRKPDDGAVAPMRATQEVDGG